MKPRLSISPHTPEFAMNRLLIIFTFLSLACGQDVVCKLLVVECIDELEMWTCIDNSDQVWYEFSDGTQVACYVSDCAIAADEATAYCNGVPYTPPEE